MNKHESDCKTEQIEEKLISIFASVTTNTSLQI